MNQIDLIILVIYLIAIVYVVYRAIDSLDEQTVIVFDRSTFEPQLQETIGETPLKNVIDINIPFADRYTFAAQPQVLNVAIINKSNTATIRIDWDNSSISDFTGRARRVIRLGPDTRLEDLSQAQVMSTIPPRRNLQALLTAEDCLKLDAAANRLQPAAPLINLDKLSAVKELAAAFSLRKASIGFSLRLLFQFTDVTGGSKRDYWHFLQCDFRITKLSRLYYLPWNPKK